MYNNTEKRATKYLQIKACNHQQPLEFVKSSAGDTLWVVKPRRLNLLHLSPEWLLMQIPAMRCSLHAGKKSVDETESKAMQNLQAALVPCHLAVEAELWIQSKAF